MHRIGSLKASLNAECASLDSDFKLPLVCQLSSVLLMSHSRAETDPASKYGHFHYTHTHSYTHACMFSSVLIMINMHSFEVALVCITITKMGLDMELQFYVLTHISFSTRV